MREKQKPVFDDTRQESFRRLYAAAYAEMREQLWKGGQYGCWGVRRRVRALARKEARRQMREYRKIETKKETVN